MIVLREAAQAIGNYRLAGSTLYVTIELRHGAGAMIQARVERLVYGADASERRRGGARVFRFSIIPTRFIALR